MPAMTRERFEAILSKAPGVAKKDGAYRVEGDHRASLYLASQGQLNLLQEVIGIRFDGELVVAECKDLTQHFLPLELIQGFAIRPPRQTPSGRTGF
jgi:hypothetical protein